MPFIDQLKSWAKQRPNHLAVIAGARSLSYSQLLTAASDYPQPASAGIFIIDEPTGTELAVQFCAAALQKRPVMVLDAGWPSALQRQLRALAQSWDERVKTDEPPFLLGLSSGTSGTPKAFLRSARSWRESFEQSSRYFCVTEATRTLAPGPLAASMNLYALGETLFTGGTFVALPQFSADAALAAMREHRVNRLVLVPSVLEIIAQRGLATGVDGGALEHIVCAGSALPPAAVELATKWAPNAVIQQYYGAAELGFVTAATVGAAHGGACQVTAGGSGGGDGAGDGGVGLPFPGVQLSIRDGDGAELPPGETGLVSVKSPYICDSYAWGDDGLAFAMLADSGWYTVHDRGSVDAGGVLHLAGRASDMIITAGNNVYPHAVEMVLEQGMGDCDVVVTGIPDVPRGQRVVGAFHRRPGTECATLDAAALMGVLRRNAVNLPAAHRPTKYFELAELPLTGSGKISRALLTQWIVEGEALVSRQD